MTQLTHSFRWLLAFALIGAMGGWCPCAPSSAGAEQADAALTSAGDHACCFQNDAAKPAESAPASPCGQDQQDCPHCSQAKLLGVKADSSTLLLAGASHDWTVSPAFAPLAFFTPTLDETLQLSQSPQNQRFIYHAPTLRALSCLIRI